MNDKDGTDLFVNKNINIYRPIAIDVLVSWQEFQLQLLNEIMLVGVNFVNACIGLKRFIYECHPTSLI